MKHLLIVGIGAGNPDHLTVQAINALNSADILFVPTKGDAKAQLAEVRRDIIARYVTRPGSRTVEFALPVRQTKDRTYEASVDQWHGAIAERYERLIAEDLSPGQSGAFLVWGDPMLYDSTIRIVERVRARGRELFDFTVIPGITSIQALAASHRIPLNQVGKPVEITTGRRLQAHFPHMIPSAVVMLDGEQAFMAIEDPDVMIYWGAYLGTPQEIIASGRLCDVREEILRTRATARERHGWIMDVYLLQKGADFD